MVKNEKNELYENKIKWIKLIYIYIFYKYIINMISENHYVFHKIISIFYFKKVNVKNMKKYNLFME